MAERWSEGSAAQEQADLFAAVAGHLRVRPHLVRVAVDPAAAVHVWGEDEGNPAGELAAWFVSVAAVELCVRLVLDGHGGGYAAVHAYDVEIGGQRVADLWGTVPGLERHLVQGGPGRIREGLRLGIGELAYFAEHGTLPPAGPAVPGAAPAGETAAWLSADAARRPVGVAVSCPDPGAVIHGLANNLPEVPTADLPGDTTADQRLLALQFVAGAKAYRDTVRAYLLDAEVPR